MGLGSTGKAQAQEPTGWHGQQTDMNGNELGGLVCMNEHQARVTRAGRRGVWGYGRVQGYGWRTAMAMNGNELGGGCTNEHEARVTRAGARGVWGTDEQGGTDKGTNKCEGVWTSVHPPSSPPPSFFSKVFFWFFYLVSTSGCGHLVVFPPLPDTIV